MNSSRRQPKTYRMAAIAAAVLVLASMACDRCGGGAAKDRVRRLAPVVRAGTLSAGPPVLYSSDWKDLNAGDAVETDASGEAELELAGCPGTLYVFMNSNLRVDTCRKVEAQSGLATCQTGTAYYNINCSSQFVVDTPSARVTIQGTAFSVTYLPDNQLTLVVLLSGLATVQSDLGLGTQELSPPVALKGSYFYYTMPGEESPEIERLPAREPVPVAELPPLVEALVLQPWLGPVAEIAGQQGVLPPDWPEFAPPGQRPDVTLGLEMDGGFLSDPAAQEAVLTAIDKAAAVEAGYGGREVGFLAAVSGQPVSAYDYEYSPRSAAVALRRAGYEPGTPVLLLYPAEDEQLARVAEVITGNLEGVGVEIKLLPVPSEAFEDRIASMREAGETMLWLLRR